MFFCQKCRNYSLVNICGHCGAKKLREAQENDPAYLATKDFICAGMLEDVLNQNKIPFIKQERNGGILKYVGIISIEEFSFYVPFGALEKAKELIAELFEPRILRLSNWKFKHGIRRTK